MLRSLACLAVSLVLAAFTCRAAEPPLFTERPLDVAIGEATAQQKLLLVVVSSNSNSQHAVEAVWSNPALREWARRHAIVLNLNDRETIRKLTGNGLVMPKNGEPLVFRNGKMIRLFGTKANAQGMIVPGNQEIKGDLSLLLRLQWTLEGVRVADENWYQQHIIKAGGDVAPAAEAIDPIALIEQARAAGAERPVEGATAFAQAWPRIAAYDRAFDGVRLGTMAREMAALGAKSPEAAGALAALRRDDGAKLDPGSIEAVASHLMLDRVCGNILDNLEFIDTSLNDADSVLLMPRSERIAMELMLPRIHLGDPGPSDPTPWAKALAAKLTSKADPKMKPDQWQRLQAFRSWLLRVECSRLHGALLLLGRREQAMGIADALLKSENSPLNKRSLVAAAVASRQALPEHLTWLDGTTDHSRSTETLRAQVQAMLKKN